MPLITYIVGREICKIEDISDSNDPDDVGRSVFYVRNVDMSWGKDSIVMMEYKSTEEVIASAKNLLNNNSSKGLFWYPGHEGGMLVQK